MGNRKMMDIEDFLEFKSFIESKTFDTFVDNKISANEANKKELAQVKEEKIFRKIDARIAAGLTTHTKEILRITRNEMGIIIEEKVASIRDELQQTAEQIFNSMEFVGEFKKQMFGHISRELNTQLTTKLNEEGLRNHVDSIITTITKDMFEGVVKKVIDQLLESMNKRLRYECRVAKDLSYSINSEIKHVLADCPISYEAEKMMQSKIIETLDGLSKQHMTMMIKEKIEMISE